MLTIDASPPVHGPVAGDSFEFGIDATLVRRAHGDSNVFGASGVPTTDDFRVVGVTSEREGVFAGGIDYWNTITAYVEWDDATPAYVVFDLDGEMTSVPTSGQTAQVTYNMGSDLLYTSGGYRNILTVYAMDAAGRLSQPMQISFWGLALPEWAVSIETMTARLAALRRTAQLLKRGHLARIEQLRHVTDTLPPAGRRKAAEVLRERYRELQLDARLDRLDKAVAENERRVRALTRQALAWLEARDYRQLSTVLDTATQLQRHNVKLLRGIERTEKRLLALGRRIAKEMHEVTDG